MCRVVLLCVVLCCVVLLSRGIILSFIKVYARGSLGFPSHTYHWGSTDYLLPVLEKDTPLPRQSLREGELQSDLISI